MVALLLVRNTYIPFSLRSASRVTSILLVPRTEFASGARVNVRYVANIVPHTGLVGIEICVSKPIYAVFLHNLIVTHVKETFFVKS